MKAETHFYIKLSVRRSYRGIGVGAVIETYNRKFIASFLIL